MPKPTISKLDVSSIATEARIKEMLVYVQKLNTEVQGIVLKSLNLKLDDANLKKQISAIQGLASASETQLREWLIKNIPQQYVDGMNITNGASGENKIDFADFQKSDAFVFHRDAINLLLKDSYLEFANTMTGLVRGAEKTLNEVAKRQIRSKIVVGEIVGSDVRTIARDIKQGLQEQGFNIMFNKSGRRVDLPTYSEMLARTQLVRTANEGVINRMTETGNDIVEWSAFEDERECPICGKLDGQIFSISGDSENYKQLPDIPAHPNCRCALLPRPELSG